MISKGEHLIGIGLSLTNVLFSSPDSKSGILISFSGFGFFLIKFSFFSFVYDILHFEYFAFCYYLIYSLIFGLI